MTDFAVINGNYASGAGIGSTVLVTEDAESVAAQTYGNVLAVRRARNRARHPGPGGRAHERGPAELDPGKLQRRGHAHGAQELTIPEIAEPVTSRWAPRPAPTPRSAIRRPSWPSTT